MVGSQSLNMMQAKLLEILSSVEEARGIAQRTYCIEALCSTLTRRDLRAFVSYLEDNCGLPPTALLSVVEALAHNSGAFGPAKTNIARLRMELRIVNACGLFESGADRRVRRRIRAVFAQYPFDGSDFESLLRVCLAAIDREGDDLEPLINMIEKEENGKAVHSNQKQKNIVELFYEDIGIKDSEKMIKRLKKLSKEAGAVQDVQVGESDSLAKLEGLSREAQGIKEEFSDLFAAFEAEVRNKLSGPFTEFMQTEDAQRLKQDQPNFALCFGEGLEKHCDYILRTRRLLNVLLGTNEGPTEALLRPICERMEKQIEGFWMMMDFSPTDPSPFFTGLLVGLLKLSKLPKTQQYLKAAFQFDVQTYLSNTRPYLKRFIEQPWTDRPALFLLLETLSKYCEINAHLKDLLQDFRSKLENRYRMNLKLISSRRHLDAMINFCNELSHESEQNPEKRLLTCILLEVEKGLASRLSPSKFQQQQLYQFLLSVNARDYLKDFYDAVALVELLPRLYPTEKPQTGSISKDFIMDLVYNKMIPAFHFLLGKMTVHDNPDFQQTKKAFSKLQVIIYHIFSCKVPELFTPQYILSHRQSFRYFLQTIVIQKQSIISQGQILQWTQHQYFFLQSILKKYQSFMRVVRSENPSYYDPSYALNSSFKERYQNANQEKKQLWKGKTNVFMKKMYSLTRTFRQLPFSKQTLNQHINVAIGFLPSELQQFHVHLFQKITKASSQELTVLLRKATYYWKQEGSEWGKMIDMQCKQAEKKIISIEQKINFAKTFYKKLILKYQQNFMKQRDRFEFVSQKYLSWLRIIQNEGERQILKFGCLLIQKVQDHFDDFERKCHRHLWKIFNILEFFMMLQDNIIKHSNLREKMLKVFNEKMRVIEYYLKNVLQNQPRYNFTSKQVLKTDIKTELRAFVKNVKKMKIIIRSIEFIIQRSRFPFTANILVYLSDQAILLCQKQYQSQFILMKDQILNVQFFPSYDQIISEERLLKLLCYEESLLANYDIYISDIEHTFIHDYDIQILHEKLMHKLQFGIAKEIEPFRREKITMLLKRFKLVFRNLQAQSMSLSQRTIEFFSGIVQRLQTYCPITVSKQVKCSDFEQKLEQERKTEEDEVECIEGDTQTQEKSLWNDHEIGRV